MSAEPTGPPPPPVAGLAADMAREPSRLKRLLLLLGPGLVSGASNDDPSAIGTYVHAGAAHGYALLWMAPLLFPMMATVVYVCGKIGLVSGRGLAEVVCDFYPRWLMYPILFALFAANVIGAGADLGAIAAAIGLLVPVPRLAAVLAVAGLLFTLQLFGSYQVVLRTFKWLALALFAYVGAGLLARPALADVLVHTVVPGLGGKGGLQTVVAMIGTALSPYLFFWQSSQQIEEKLKRGRRTLRERRGASGADLKFASIDVTLGMLFACVVIYFVILACGATLHAAGKHDVGSAAEAALALQPIAGRFAGALFAVGLIGAGALAVPVLTTGAAYAFAEALGWRYGLDHSPLHARRFYTVMTVAMAGAVLFNLAGTDPMKALFFAATVNGFLAPPLIVLVLHISNRRKVMGNETNRPLTNVLGAIAALAATAAAVGALLG